MKSSVIFRGRKNAENGIKSRDGAWIKMDKDEGERGKWRKKERKKGKKRVGVAEKEGEQGAMRKMLI